MPWKAPSYNPNWGGSPCAYVPQAPPTIEYRDGNIVLTDLMDRQLSFEGELVMANLVEGVAVIREKLAQ